MTTRAATTKASHATESNKYTGSLDCFMMGGVVVRLRGRLLAFPELRGFLLSGELPPRLTMQLILNFTSVAVADSMRHKLFADRRTVGRVAQMPAVPPTPRPRSNRHRLRAMRIRIGFWSAHIAHPVAPLRPRSLTSFLRL
jgi:hypothetical protein